MAIKTLKQRKQWELYSSLGSITCLHAYINQAEKMVAKVETNSPRTIEFNKACYRFHNALERIEQSLRKSMKEIK